MQFVKKSPQDILVVLLMDPLQLDSIPLDIAKSKTPFDRIAYFEGNFIAFETDKEHVKASLQNNRLVIKDTNTTEFNERNTKIIAKLINVLPPLSVKALGTSLFLSVEIDGEKSAAELTKNTFLSTQLDLKKLFQEPVLSNSTRIFYGSSESYYDLRLTPPKFTGPELGIQLHRHQDTNITKNSELSKTIITSINSTIKELNRLLGELASISQ